MNNYIDAHCHYSGGKNTFFNATRPDEWDAVVAHVRDGGHGAIGIHPWYISDANNNAIDKLRQILAKNPKLMVGEIGLDKYRPDMDRQIEIFCQQLYIATQMRRGVHIHCVGAWDKMQKILKCRGQKLPPFILFHRYSGNVADMPRLAEKYNAFFSYNNVNDATRIAQTPGARILVESDMNIPTDTTQIIQNIAAIRNTTHAEMWDILYKNFIRMVQNG